MKREWNSWPPRFSGLSSTGRIGAAVPTGLTTDGCGGSGVASTDASVTGLMLLMFFPFLGFVVSAPAGGSCQRS